MPTNTWRFGDIITRSGLGKLAQRLKSSSKLAKLMAVFAALAVPIGLIADGVSLFKDVSEDASVSVSPETAPVQNTEPDLSLESRISFNYMRTFGAVRNASLMTAIRESGFSDVGEEGGTLKESGLVISGELPAFYRSWKYRDIQPLGNRIWEEISSISSGYERYLPAGIRTEDTDLREKCLEQLIGYPDEEATFPFECSIDVQNNVGYLFLIIEGREQIPTNMIRFSYIDTSEHSNSFDWQDYRSSEVENICKKIDPTKSNQQVHGQSIQTRSISGISPNNSYLWPVAVYQTEEESRFRGNLIDGALVPLCLHAEGFDPLPIRAPEREDAITVQIPDGWYWQ